VGGLETLRGYPDESIGPVDSLGAATGGIYLMLASGEVRVPLGGGVSGSVFLDAGQPAVKRRHLRWDAASVGAGVSMQLRVPVGRLRCSVAVPVTARYGEGAQYYLGSGSAF
jgi:outer membrane translocation and assembly module TamA